MGRKQCPWKQQPCFRKIWYLVDREPKNLLTFTQNRGTITTKDKGKENPTNQKGNIAMKKATLESIRTALLNSGVEETDPMVVELTAELNKGEAVKAKNAEAYASIHDIMIGALEDKPATVSEIWDVIANKVPDGITKGKVQYALTHLWQDEIVKVPGNPNGYRKA